MSEKKRVECLTCKHKRYFRDTHHIACDKPDPDMEGNPHGVKNGWFIYPYNFDPVWKERECVNYENGEK